MFTRVMEIVLSLGLVLISFLAILLLLSWSFPEGSSLTQLMSEGTRSLLEQRDSSWDYRLGAAGAEPVVARLTQTHRRVKDKPVHAIAWSDSRTGRVLRNRHSVQTFSRSGATITFGNETQLELAENTLIVLREMRRSGSGKRRGSLMVLGGTLNANLGSAGSGGFEIILPNGSAELAATDGEGSFRVTINEDKSSTVTVFDGTAEIRTSDGKRILSPDQALTISYQGQVGPPATIPPPPRTAPPSEGAVVSFREIPPRVEFSWEAEEAAQTYRFQIATDPDFQEIVHEDRIETTSFTHGSLRNGTYYWRVRGINGWVSGHPSETRVLEMRQDLEAPVLHVTFPENPVEHQQIVLRGSTEVSARIYIDDVEILTSITGEFEHELALQPGINVMVVEAVDRAGNVTYESRLIRATY